MKVDKNNLLLSLIIPVYNVEAYLQECVDSILLQITDECEIILVDDGSPDRCPEICEEYAKEDSRIKVLHKENGGLSSARNAGLAVAIGRYVTFIDSDDRIFPDSLKYILQLIKSEYADMCFLQSVKLYPDGTQKDLGECIESAYLKAKSHEDSVRYLASRPKYPGSAWAKLYRREFLINNKLHFPYDRRYSEDLGFMRDCILYAQSFDALDVPYYQYRQSRQGSITNKITCKNFYDLLQFIIESVEKLTVNKEATDIIKKSLMSFVAYEYSILLYLYASIPKGYKRDALIKLREYKWTLRYARNTREKAISMICSLVGVKVTAFLIKQYRKTVEK